MEEATPATSVAQERKRPQLPTWVRWLRELVAIALWVATLAQLLLFDIASVGVEAVPALELLWSFRLLVALGLAAALWFVLGNHLFTRLVGYVVAYPFVIVLWHLPRLLFRNWVIVVVFFPAIHSLISTFRTNFLLFTVALISATVVCLAEPRWLILSCMILAGVYLGIHYFRRFRIAFSPSTAFADIGGRVRRVWEDLRGSPWLEPPAGESTSDEYKEEFGQTLLQAYMTTTVLHVFAARIEEVNKSRRLDLYLIAAVVYTFALTVVVFGVEYFGLYRLSPVSFEGVERPNLLDFIGYSFSTIMTSDISPLRGVSRQAEFLAYLQLFGSLLIIVLLVFVLLTSSRERYRHDLGWVVKELGLASNRCAQLIENNFDLTLAAAESLLLEHNAWVARKLLKWRYGEEEAEKIPGYTETSSTAEGVEVSYESEGE